ncbi:hypothetical protein GT715_10490 [Clostridium beijerinckii]|uniref:Uncharacterized protein n=1 Tax=Clostridium beijerinckii TaxID=1520 RepID=A0A1S9N8W4_CLOBE|nr:hypothetical protein [Clostridium beijerinckii]MZK59107.1 hypothetical protein [Clostridium beijerinckii]MZK69226.1 hypothetical protein [Clostridium beijerinckii]MZK74598.1 hypothetical protein [Clostridium beijerinckii]MZK84318.1 hypothetical protein [Clostridium beijerinckii]
MVINYIDSDEVRAYVKTLADSAGVRILKKEKYLHMLVNPYRSVFATSLSDLKKNVKTYESKIDLYLIGIIWLILFSEADTNMSTKISWENEGLTYQKIEELTTKVLNYWKSIDEKESGKFSIKWSLATKDLHNKWKLLHYNSLKNGRVYYPKNTKFGVIDSAMRELEKNKMVFIRKLSQTSVVTPTVVFYERLQACFGNLGKYRDRYELIKSLVNEAKASDLEVN